MCGDGRYQTVSAKGRATQRGDDSKRGHGVT